MKIIGAIDNSLNSPGVVKFICDDQYNIEKVLYLGFDDRVKVADKNLIQWKKSQFNNNIGQILFMTKRIDNFLKDCEYVALEDFAFGGTGRLTDLAESVGMIKASLYARQIPLRMYNVFVIKKFALGKASNDKDLMVYKFIDTYKNKIKSDLSKIDDNTLFKNPYNDIIDAFFICLLLKHELMIRAGIKKVENYDPKRREVFVEEKKEPKKKKVAKPDDPKKKKVKVKISILDKPFIKGDDNEIQYIGN